MSELSARRLDDGSGDQMHVELWLQYKRNRATAMNNLGRGSSKPASTTANREAEAFHINEAQKDLLALGLLEDTATNPSSRQVMWKAAIVKFEWITTKDSVCRKYLRGIAAHHRLAAKDVMTRHLIASVQYRENGHIIFEGEALKDPCTDIAPVIGLSTEHTWETQTIRQADHSVADYALTGQNGPTDSLVQGRSKRKLLLEGSLPFSAVKRARPDHSALVGDVTSSPPVYLASAPCSSLSYRHIPALEDLKTLELSHLRDRLKNNDTELSAVRDENAHLWGSLSELEGKHARSQQLLEEFKKSEIHMMQILSQEKEARERIERTASDEQAELDELRRGLQRDKGLQDKVKEHQRTISALEKRLQDAEEKGLAYRKQISILKCTNRKHSAEVHRLHERMEEYSHSNREFWHGTEIKLRQQREAAWEEERRRHQQKVTELRERLVQLENMNKILVAHNPVTLQGGQRHHIVRSQRGEGSTQAQVEQKTGLKIENTHSRGQTAELLRRYEMAKIKKEKRGVKNETM